MSLFDSLGTPENNTPQTPAQAVNQIKSNPAEFLKSRGYNIPAGINIKNPGAIINSLLQSGQIPMNRYQQIIQRLGRR